MSPNRFFLLWGSAALVLIAGEFAYSYYLGERVEQAVADCQVASDQEAQKAREEVGP